VRPPGSKINEVSINSTFFCSWALEGLMNQTIYSHTREMIIMRRVVDIPRGAGAGYMKRLAQDLVGGLRTLITSPDILVDDHSAQRSLFSLSAATEEKPGRTMLKGGLAAQFAAAAIAKTTTDRVALVDEGHWLDHVDMSMHGKNQWGQSVAGMPLTLQPFMLRVPSIVKKSRGERMTWNDMAALRAEVMQLLREGGVEVIDARKGCEFRNGADHSTMDRMDGEGTARSSLLYPDDTILDWSQKFRELSKAELPSGMAQPPSCTDLYKLGEHEVPKTIIVRGNGPSAVWIAQHFRNSHVIALVRETDESRYISAFGEQSTYGNLQRVPYDPVKNPAHGDLLSPSGAGTASLRLPDGTQCEGRFYRAVGYTPIGTDATAPRFVADYIRRRVGTGALVAPEPTPAGALADSVARLFLACGRPELAIDLTSFYNYGGGKNNALDAFAVHLERKGITNFDSKSFFAGICEKITPVRCQATKELLSGLDYAPSVPEIREIYEEVFKTTQQDASPQDMQAFNKAVVGILDVMHRRLTRMSGQPSKGRSRPALLQTPRTPQSKNSEDLNNSGPASSNKC
jgi:hypothetical protein